MILALTKLLFGGRVEAAAPEPARIARVHDYRTQTRRWGHDIVWHRRDGDRLYASGWGPAGGPRIQVGDELLTGTEVYGDVRRLRVAAIDYHLDPPDMWRAEFVEAPRD